MLDQRFADLDEIAGDRVHEVLARGSARYVVDGRELTPAQLLERLGFASEHLSARVGDLSGGQKRRLQLLTVLMAEPNVLILDEPTNDVDTDMLAAMEDLLDSWPGTLIVVSHDRYLVERVTDQHYAILDGRLRHLPGGVDEYLRLRAEASDGDRRRAAPLASSEPGDAEPSDAGPSAAEQRAARKEIAAAEKKLSRLADRISAVHERMAAHDHSDYEGLPRLTEELHDLERQTADIEERWLELADIAG